MLNSLKAAKIIIKLSTEFSLSTLRKNDNIKFKTN